MRCLDPASEVLSSRVKHIYFGQVMQAVLAQAYWVKVMAKQLIPIALIKYMIHTLKGKALCHDLQKQIPVASPLPVCRRERGGCPPAVSSNLQCGPQQQLPALGPQLLAPAAAHAHTQMA